MRAPVVRALGAWLVLSWCGCGGGEGAVTDAPDLGPRSTLTDEEIGARRGACAFDRGTLPGVSLPAGAPIGPEIPVDTIVVLMMENRSFDHLLGDLPAAGQPDALVAGRAAENRGADGAPVLFHRATELCTVDTEHGWAESHEQWNGGRNDGFVRSNERGGRDGGRAMTFYTAEEMPFFYGLATTFALADHFHASLLGPTWPNRDYLYAATSVGITSNHLPGRRVESLMTRLDEAGIDWHVYFSSLPGVGGLGNVQARHLDSISLLAGDAAAGTLAGLVFIDADLNDNARAAKNDLHPPGDVQLGDRFLDETLALLMASPQWPRMAVFVTFDEHGGFFDHVPPPPACAPDDIPPEEPGGGFDRLGFRVPLVVVSPWARAHHVSHRTYDLTSITRFVETRFLLPALTRRDANADPLLDLFDFSQPRFRSPPGLPRSTVDLGRFEECKRRFPPL